MSVTIRRISAWLGVVAALLFGAATAAAAAEVLSRSEVEADLREFFEVFLDRPLSGAELDQATGEYIAHFGSTACEAVCAETLDGHLANAAVMAEKAGEPDDLILRHAYIRQSHYEAREQAPLIHRLMTEPDPIALTDARVERLMTERDVEGLANLVRFLESEDAPRHTDFAEDQIKAGAEDLRAAIAAGDTLRKMPLIYSAAAEIWAGIRREWPSLTASERQIVRDYARHGPSRPLTLALYGRIFGLGEAQAHEIQALDARDRQLAEIRGMLSRYVGVMGDALITQNLIQSMQDAVR